ncbi:MAG TPA: signal recognition particle-docking protein FtsY [bacterium]|nr:signal recognition particle-docking protein FtsY [bacterium]HPR87456.1 signal recognition particle-docking protein FtsY [bacterium]
MLNVFKKFQNGLARTKSGLVEGIQRIVSQTRGLDESVLEELEELLILSDLGVATTETVLDGLRQRSLESGQVDAAAVLQLLKQELVGQLERSTAAAAVERPAGQLCVVSVVGVNGAGKTTTIGKLAHLQASQGRKVLLAAADTFRAAAADQLEIWRDRAGVEIVLSQSGADPAAVAFDALKAAMARQVDYLFIDTAGRLHTKGNLMAELEKIHKVLARQCPGAPHEVLLVIDATTGQNGLSQARKFAESVAVTGLVVTKLDGTAKGGIVFAIARELGIPVRYVGLGEGMDDLQEFDPRTFVEALFS